MIDITEEQAALFDKDTCNFLSRFLAMPKDKQQLIGRMIVVAANEQKARKREAEK